MSDMTLGEKLLEEFPIGKTFSNTLFVKACQRHRLMGTVFEPDPGLIYRTRAYLNKSVLPQVNAQFISIGHGWLTCFTVEEAIARNPYPEKAARLLNNYIEKITEQCAVAGDKMDPTKVIMVEEYIALLLFVTQRMEALMEPANQFKPRLVRS